MTQQPSISDIRKAVSAYYDMPVDTLLSRTAKRSIARPRQIAVYLTREITGRSLPDIARQFGFCDHTTAIHAVRAVEQRIAEDKHGTRAAVATIRAQLDGDQSLWRRAFVNELQACLSVAAFVREAMQ